MLLGQRQRFSEPAFHHRHTSKHDDHRTLSTRCVQPVPAGPEWTRPGPVVRDGVIGRAENGACTSYAPTPLVIRSRTDPRVVRSASLRIRSRGRGRGTIAGRPRVRGAVRPEPSRPKTHPRTRYREERNRGVSRAAARGEARPWRRHPLGGDGSAEEVSTMEFGTARWIHRGPFRPFPH